MKEEDALYTTIVMLVPLLAKLSMLNRLTMKVIFRGLMDIKLTWKSEKPLWWPATIPLQNNIAPSNCEGKQNMYFKNDSLLLLGKWSNGVMV